MATLTIEGRQIMGLLDTGADKSIISTADWPKNWPIQQSGQNLQGLGYAKSPNITAKPLKWKDEEGHEGFFQPFVLDLPLTLWGRDVLTNMGIWLTNEHSETSMDIMTRMGYKPGKGLGKNLQGHVKHIDLEPKLNRHGLCFS